MFTSKGNQPPMFTLTMPEQFKTPGREYLVHHAPQMVEYIYNWLHQQSSTGLRATIRSTVDHMNAFNKKKGFRKFNFSYTCIRQRYCRILSEFSRSKFTYLLW